MVSEREITYSRAAAKALLKIDQVQAKRIVAKIEQYAVDPESLANNVTQLVGSDVKRLRVADYRVIFSETLEVLAVLRIGHRRDVYE